MSHDQHSHSTENKTIISFKNSFWLVIILVFLFIAALNFVQAESGAEEGHGGHHEAETHEMHNGAAAHESAAPAHETPAEQVAPATHGQEAPATEAPAAEQEHH